MSALDNKQLINLIRYAPVAVVFVFALAVNLIAIQDSREQAAQSIQNLREELTAQRKDAIRSEVHQLNTQLLLKKSNVESQLRSIAKERVYEAYGIANHIYLQNIGKSKAEISRLIVEALRPLRFFDGRGYFFIIADDGMKILNAGNPDLEGKNGWNLKGQDGRYVARDMLAITRKTGEGFMRWQFKKPETSASKEFEKIGFLKKFEPLNWTIGTGEYLIDYESDVKSALLKRLSEYEYGENGYFFVLDNEGTLLAQHANDFLGLDFIIGKKINDKLIKQINAKVDQGGGFVRYAKPLTLSGNTILDQVSYVKRLKGWDWIVGTGFSAQAFEKYLSIKEAQFDEFNHQSLMRLIYLTIVSMVLLTISTLIVSNLIAKRFEMFQQQIKDDFDELNHTKDNMEYMALHDALTGLPNRVLMMQNIRESIESASGENEKIALMFVDLDNFKNVNDLYGHHIGDQLLESVSQRFKALIQAQDTASRFGGDEFVFCFANLKDRAEAEEKANQIIQLLSTPIIIDGKPLIIGCSIGVSMYPDDSMKPEILIRQADTVLYQSKANKKGQVLFYSNNINTQIKRRMEIEQALVNAIESKALTVHYQPQMSAHGERLVSVEALARWHHPTLGHIYPDEFIDIAEQTGNIHQLDLFVFTKACEDILSLSPNGQDALKLSVNISPLQLSEPGLSDALFDICMNVGIEPERITLEITENIFIHGLDKVQPALSELRAQGFGVSLDDFGTGYSSLSYINSLPLTEIKIDRSFTELFLDSYQSDMLVRMIISIARVYGLIVVAEGVETKPQFSKLINYGCDLFQGYYFDRPLTFTQLSERLNNQTFDAANNQADTVDVKNKY